MVRATVAASRVGSEVAQIRVVDRFDGERRVVRQSAFEAQRTVVECDGRGERDRQYAPVLAEQILPAKADLVIGDLFDLGGVLLAAEDEIVAAVGQGRQESEGDAQFGSPLDGPVGGLALQPGQCART
jgi:uncharacterized protein GlcG (DUF336 family)